jgi:hypothetical protein
MKVGRLSCFSLLAVVFSTGLAFAQSQDQAPAVAAIVGINQSYFAASPSGETNMKTGAMVGVFGVMRRDKGFKIQPEAQISQRRVGVVFGGEETEYALTYLNLTLNTRLHVFKGVYTTTGPQFSIPVMASWKILGEEADIKDNITWDWSIVIGVGKQFGRFGLEGRWDAGFRGIEEVPVGGFVKRNRAITIFGIIALD